MDLLNNPFHILGANPRDNRQRIMALAEERSLYVSASDCTQARSDLMNPRKRLSVEVAWLPGVGPKRISELLLQLESENEIIFKPDNFNPLALANLVAAVLSRSKSNINLSFNILWLARVYEQIKPEELCAILNEERIVSGFPEISDPSAVEEELKERRNYFKRVIKSALDKLYSDQIIEVVTSCIKSATENGADQGPVLIYDMVDSYEVEAQEFLTREEENIRSCAEKIKASLGSEYPDLKLGRDVNRLSQVVRNWENVAKPIQISNKSKGLDDGPSRRVAGIVRGLGIDLFNKHSKLDLALLLTNLLKETFEDVLELSELVDDDLKTLRGIEEKQRLGNLLDPISTQCSMAMNGSNEDASKGIREAQQIIDYAPQLLSALNLSNASNEIVSAGKDQIALTIMHCVVVYGNKTDKWKDCVSPLRTALQYASSQDAKERIQKNLSTAENNETLTGNLTPISSAPSLSTINGCGFAMYGATDHDPVSKSYISTYYFVLLLIPIFPICRYRVIPAGPQSYKFLGKAPLRTFDKWHLGIAIAIGVIIFLNLCAK